MKGGRSAQHRGRRNDPPGMRLAARMLAAVAMIAAWHCSGDGALAQQARPAIVVGEVLPVPPGNAVPFPVRIAPLSAVPRGGFVRLLGLPPTAALSQGYSIAPGAWSVPVTALADLTILLPQGATGRWEVSVRLVSRDGAMLDEARTTVAVAAPAPMPAIGASPAARPAPQPVQPAIPQISGEARERALRLVKKGDEQLAEGGIAQARLLYERAAEAGLAAGAMAMAATYDPIELQRLGAHGLNPDPEAARRWYERARQLGAREAEERLRRLPGN